MLDDAGMVNLLMGQEWQQFDAPAWQLRFSFRIGSFGAGRDVARFFVCCRGRMRNG